MPLSLLVERSSHSPCVTRRCTGYTRWGSDTTQKWSPRTSTDKWCVKCSTYCTHQSIRNTNLCGGSHRWSSIYTASMSRASPTILLYHWLLSVLPLILCARKVLFRLWQKSLPGVRTSSWCFQVPSSHTSHRVASSPLSRRLPCLLPRNRYRFNHLYIIPTLLEERKKKKIIINIYYYQ